MDDLTSKINEIMSDPEKLKEIQNLGKMMGLNTGENNSQKSKPQQQPMSKSMQNSNSSNLLGNLGGIDPSLIGKIAPMLSAVNQEDETTRLFDAMVPFLSAERQEKLKKIRKMMVIMKLLPNIKNLGLF